MSRRHRHSPPALLVACSTALIAAAACSRSGDEPAPAAGVFAIRGARVFDGTRFLPGATVVVVRGGTIAAVGPDVAVPAGAEVIDGSGKTLLPGLIDAHTHRHEHDRALEQALALGVTTELGMMGDPALARRRREEEAAGGAPDRAALRSAGWAITVPDGLGSDEPLAPVLEPGADEAAFVRARVAEGSEYIEVMFDDGTAWGVPHATLGETQLAKVVAAAHAARRLVLVDIASHGEAARAIAAGVDGLAHLSVQGADPELARAIRAAGAFVIATLPVLFSICDGTRGAALADDPAIAPYLMPAADRALRQSYALFSPGADCRAILAGARELSALGVPILAGTDAGGPGTTHGASMHDALALLVDAGLTPAEALAAATSVPARVFHLDGVGRIAPGLRADLLLVEGDPSADIRATRAIAAVWKRGVRLDRTKQKAAAAAARSRDAVEPAAAGGIGRFEDDDGDGWQARADQVRGGGSQAAIVLVDRDGRGGGALAIEGDVRAGAAAPWAGAVRFLAQEPPAPVDLRAVQSLRFAARGDGGTYRVLLFTLGGGPVPVEIARFAAGARWTEQSVPLTGLADRGEVVAVLFSAGPTPGHFRFEIDDVELR